MDQPQEVVQNEVSVEDRIRNYLFPEESRPRDEQGRFAPKTQPEEQEAEAPVSDEPTGDIEEEVNVADTDSAEEATEEEAPQTYTVKVDGEELNVTLDEALKGYMRQADYTRKTTELSEARKIAQREIQARLEQERTQYVGSLEALQQAVLAAAAPELQGVNWDQLASEDPAEYVRKVNRANQVNQLLQHINAEREKAVTQQQQEQRSQFEEMAKEANETLKRELPKWDLETYQSYMKFTVDNYGFSPEEAGQVVDPRMWKVVHDAIQWRNLQSKKPVIEKKVAEAPKATKPGAKNQKQDPTVQLRQQFKKSGRVEDLANFLLAKESRRK